MLKWRDFYLMKVYKNNKYIGVIEDISIDFSKGIIIGFVISPASLFKKDAFITIESIESIDGVIKVSDTSKFEGIKFRDIKYREIVDEKDILIGVLEDLVIEKESFNIKALIISSGIFDKMFKGKDIIMLRDCSLYKDYILYSGSNRIKVKSLPHNIGGFRDAKKA